jgi:outer membrane lipoprotein-sorting protein
MGRKLLIGLVVVVSAICVLTSCSKKSRNAEDIISYLKNLQSYSCNVKIQIKNDKQKNQLYRKAILQQ